jgi:hypothetical protein
VFADDVTAQVMSGLQPFGVAVAKASIPPRIGPIPTVNLNSGDVRTLGLPVEDAIGDPVRFSLSGAPPWISIDPNTGSITVSPPLSVGGAISAAVLALDTANPSLTGSQTFTVNVQGIPPQIIGFNTNRSRKGATAVTLIFNEPLDAGTAGDPGHYSVTGSTSARGQAKRRIGVVPGYNAANNSVTLRLSRWQRFRVQVIVGGLRAANGATLDSPVTLQVQ